MIVTINHTPAPTPGATAKVEIKLEGTPLEIDSFYLGLYSMVGKMDPRLVGRWSQYEIQTSILKARNQITAEVVHA